MLAFCEWTNQRTFFFIHWQGKTLLLWERNIGPKIADCEVYSQRGPQRRRITGLVVRNRIKTRLAAAFQLIYAQMCQQQQNQYLKVIKKAALSPAILCLAICVYVVTNRSSMCGRDVYNVMSQQCFPSWLIRSKSTWLDLWSSDLKGKKYFCCMNI